MQNVASSNKKRLIWVIGVFAIPVVISYVAYYIWQPQGAVRNYGQLIPVQTIAASAELLKPDGTRITAKALRGKWAMLTFDAGACDAVCEKKLYAMRQVRLMQGREQDRVQRIRLTTDATAFPAALHPMADGVLQLRDPAAAVTGLLQAPEAIQQHIFLIDPLGNIMLRWPENPDLKRMHKDLERLLKYSQIG